MPLQTPNGKNFFVRGSGFAPVGARLMGPVLPVPEVEEQGDTLFLAINSSPTTTSSGGSSAVPVLSAGSGGQVISVGPGQVLQTGPSGFISSTIPITLIFTRPDGVTFTRSSPNVYIGQITLPQLFNGRPFALTSNFYAVYTFAADELEVGGLWLVAVLSINGQQVDQGMFFVKGFVLAPTMPPPEPVPSPPIGLFVPLTPPTTYTLPSPSSGAILTLKDVSGMAGSINIIVSGGGFDIDGSPTFTINQDYAAYTFVWNGSSWSVV
jgi:hypothetical protein